MNVDVEIRSFGSAEARHGPGLRAVDDQPCAAGAKHNRGCGLITRPDDCQFNSAGAAPSRDGRRSPDQQEDVGRGRRSSDR